MQDSNHPFQPYAPSQQPPVQQPPEGTYQPPQQYAPPTPLPGQPYQQAQAQPQFHYPQPPQAQPYLQQPMMQQQTPYPQPAPMYYQPQGAPVMVSNVNVNVQGKSGPGFVARALYFCFIGWWLGFFWLQIGFALCVLIVTLPLGLVMLNMLPTVLTLRPRSSGTSVNVSTVAVQPGAPGMPGVMVQNVNVNVGGKAQQSFLVRAVYFCFVGWWAGYLWACLGYGLCVLVVTLPLGLMMLNRLPTVLTLQKN